VGLLLPQSTIYPALAESFVAGLQLYSAGATAAPAMPQSSLAFIRKPIGFGPSAAFESAEELLTQDHVDVVAGVLSSDVIASLHDLFREHNGLLLASNAGENVPRHSDGSARNSHALQNTLALWQANWALGAWAARTIGKKAVMAGSFYDSGYDAFYAFQLGFEGAGGRVLDTYVTHRPTDDRDLTQVLRRIMTDRPDVVFAAYCGDQAVEFVRAYATSALHGRAPLLGSGFLVDEHILPAQGAAAVGIRTALRWPPDLLSPAGDALSAAFQQQTGWALDPFGVLGFETAHLLTEAMAVAGNTVSQIRNALASPRRPSAEGLTTMRHGTQAATAPIYLREVQWSGGELRNHVLTRLDSIEASDQCLQALCSSPKTGWLNAYLCA
jgi:branched-chain amino acid transport system substrate-binding protein